MGSSSSKFKKYLHHGDEFAAMQVFQCSPELRKNLDPNLSYGEHHNHNTALHCVAKHGMKHLLRTFLCDLGGNPNKKNGFNETSLHTACQLMSNKSFSAMERRAACVMLILQWNGTVVNGGAREKIDIGAQDINGNTALHVAAASGLDKCVQLLLAAGASMFVENYDKFTPCDMAVKHDHHMIAQLLESRMVFDDTLDLHNEDELSSQGQSEMEEVYCGLRTQDLQEAKDQLLVETSDMLQVPLFTAEALLRDNEWSRELLLEKWMKDSVTCCELAGVEPPQSAYHQNNEVTLVPTDNIRHDGDQNETGDENVTCEICLVTLKSWEMPDIKLPCSHNFCLSCWETYLSNKILEGIQHNILCPSFQCHILIPNDFIETIVSSDLAKRYLHFDIKAFVESSKCIKWCPVASCGRAVRLPETEQMQPVDELRNLPNRKRLVTSHAVDCGNGHFFCWECLDEAHSPSGCLQWREWQEKIAQIKPEEIKSNLKDFEHVSNCLWLVTNSKPCPNCNSPIQKNEGCNHIKCSKCKFDFCWVCLEAWKKHSSATGGYFRCNRYPAALKADEKQGMLISEALVKKQQSQDLNKFLHYYTRFKNHENSRLLEEPLLTTVKHRMEVLASSLSSTKNNKEVVPEKEKTCTKFVEDGVRELLKARRVLCGSYVHGFYLEDNGYNKTIFELMQNELEEVTEKLSEMIARPYLKTSRHVIMQTTSLARRKRHEFVRAVAKGLIPPETPPSTRRRRRRFPGLFPLDPISDETSHAIAVSLKNLDPNNPWIKDALGRHNNLSAIYEWPDVDSDEETEVTRALAVSLVGECARDGCSRPRARNPRTQTIHEFCSLKCARLNTNNIPIQTVTHDYYMDLAIALEMSRLQMIEDNLKREKQLCFRPSTSVSNTQTDSELELSKAIEMSLEQQQLQQDNIRLCVVDITDDININKKTTEDVSVDYFLKSLAGQNLQTICHDSVNIFSPDADKNIMDKELIMFRPEKKEDGRFEISDIHDTTYSTEDVTSLQCLRRVRSTGDLCQKDCKGKYKEPRYHLDSDHSSQHDDKPEEIVDRIFTFPVNVNKTTLGKQQMLIQQNGSNCNQSSLEDTTISDSINADLEVCEILSSSTEVPRIKKEDEIVQQKKTETEDKSEVVKNLIKEVRSTIQSIEDESKVSSFQIFNFEHFDDSEFVRQTPERASTGKIKNVEMKKGTNLNKPMLLGSEKTLHEAHKKAFKAAGGKILHKNKNLKIRIAKSPMVTDSSNEYETETGIPKSPTLFISGVSICRTPEPLVVKTSPVEEVQECEVAPLSSSVVVAVPTETDLTDVTDGGSSLSSVLHVHESYLSSDDFHEVLFLLDSSPKHGSKKKKKCRRDRDKSKESKEESSSAL